jgi:hypothetical protein
MAAMNRIVRLDSLQQFAAINTLSDPGYINGPKVIPNACMVRLNWQLTDGKVAHNVLYATYNGTPALSTVLAQQVFAAISTGASWTALAAFLIPTSTLTGVTLLDVRSNVGTEFQSTGAPVPGTSTGTALPDEVAAAVKLSTLNRGPSGRGRYYIPGFASNAVGAGGVIAAGCVTAINNWAGNVANSGLSAIIGPQVLGLPARAAYTSPITGRNFPARNAQTVALTGVQMKDNHWDSQRRRGLK